VVSASPGTPADDASATLAPPHGGHLVDLHVTPARAGELRASLRELPSWDLTPRQFCDLEMIASGAFSPLTGFMGRAAAESVARTLRLPATNAAAEGLLWPIPITLDVAAATAEAATRAGALVLRDAEGLPLAVLRLAEAWEHDRRSEAELVYGTLDEAHPGVHHLLHRTNNVALGGALEVLQLPPHYDFVALRETPAQARAAFARLGWRRVVAFQTRNPMHRAHFELTHRAASEQGAHLLIHPAVGMTRPGDLDHYTRVRCYQALLGRYPAGLARLALLPLAMRMAGPREALLHAIVRKNFGCTHFIVGRDHAGPGSDKSGRPFYGPYAAQELVSRHEGELGIRMVPFREMVFLAEEGRYRPQDEVPAGAKTLSLSGTELRRRLAEGREIPEWFTFPEVAVELRRTHPPRAASGFTIFMTGLSGAGKSTIARALQVKLLERGGRPVTLLDGDLVRKHLSSELGFSKEHRDLNVRRIGFVASEITKNGGIALCAPIAPYDAVRKEVRELIAPLGGFLLVHVATAIEVCEQRDAKGLYAKARAGLLPGFTGVSDPYEAPTDAEVVVDGGSLTPLAAAEKVLAHLEAEGYLAGTAAATA
jgi:sulfate adenylyltransferase